jgi:hypothetical protein
LGSLCKDRCGLRKLGFGPSVCNSENTIWPTLADAVAKCVDGILGTVVTPKCAHLAGFGALGGGGSMLSCLEQIGFKPSGGRAVSTVSSRVASCVQPCKRLAPTILPEGLGPATPELETHVEHAISSQPLPETLIARRKRCCEVLVKLCAALQDEWNAWLPRVHCDIRPIVGRRMVPFCREISLVTQFIDIPLWADYVCGLPMAGWACHSMALPPKLTAPSATVQSIAAVAPGHKLKDLC